VTPDAGSQGAAPESLPSVSRSEDAAATEAQQLNPARKKKERPKTILGLIEYAYGEGGRKLGLARKDLRELRVDSAASQAEIDAVRRFAADDPFLAVPPSLLASLAELGAEPPVRRRVLELVLVAFASHRLFESRLERLTDAMVQPSLTAREVSDAARKLTFDVLGLKEASDFKEASRERLRVNAVTAFELFRVLREGWTSDRFVDDMSALVWDVPIQPSTARAAALLATAKNTDALSQLSRHFEVLLRESQRATGDASAQAMQQGRRAESAEASVRSLAAELEAERTRVTELEGQVIDLTRRLSAEEKSRAVDRSHHVDDYESLRTRVIRRLTAQIELLGDGLHALRNGSPEVTDEYLDRALTAFGRDVESLRETDGGQR
jgi:hypothetical protein